MSLDTPRAEARPGRMPAHDVHQRLEHERNARLTQLRAVGEAGDGADEHMMAVQRETIERVLKEIEAAFTRLADGSHGTCMGCARTIPVERLEILPYTRFCVPCQRTEG
ncbi:TraR/DksA C4-type zinc finger protein [Streptomyces sp. NPDC048002]|uniref:TraR/DksA C4-type zinc finger protein n=1 Tax=unclassified Streptomyces TaxID=2593676 RepID=UPI0033FD34D8